MFESQKNIILIIETLHCYNQSQKSLAVPLCLGSMPSGFTSSEGHAFYGPVPGLLPKLDDQVVLYPQGRLKIVDPDTSESTALLNPK